MMNIVKYLLGLLKTSNRDNLTVTATHYISLIHVDVAWWQLVVWFWPRFHCIELSFRLSHAGIVSIQCKQGILSSGNLSKIHLWCYRSLTVIWQMHVHLSLPIFMGTDMIAVYPGLSGLKGNALLTRCSQRCWASCFILIQKILTFIPQPKGQRFASFDSECVS